MNEILFKNCEIGTVRGIMRIRNTVEIDSFKIVDCVVDSLGSYGILTADTDPSTPATAHVNNFFFKNSTFNKIQVIKPEGWHNWNKPDAEKTTWYAEYGSTGPGADTSRRVKWAHMLTGEESQSYSVKNVFGDWEP